MKKLCFVIVSSFTIVLVNAQDTTKGASLNRVSLHWQTTIIPQYHFNFNPPYTGKNSLLPSEPVATSFTSTLFFNYKASKNTYFVFNPELAAGKALGVGGGTTGVAGFPNGETYRVGNPKLNVFIARLYAEQRFALSKVKEAVEDDENQISENTHRDYVSFIVGKFSLTDFFDESTISHDPRTQFMNWSLMGSGGWDYPANTRGYTMGLVVQLKVKNLAVRYANVAMPTTANGPNLEWKGSDAMGQVVEFAIENFHLIKTTPNLNHSFHLGICSNRAFMGNYATSINTGLQNNLPPDITDSRQYGRTKNAFYITLDNNWNKVHHFIKFSKNDGKNETYAFTEIDNSMATGLQFDGSLWKCKEDVIGIAFVENGLSDNHRTYLENGGYGFIIGDGKLNYDKEKILETYYSCRFNKHVAITADYQKVINPAYNKDRGSVDIVSLRLHTTL